MQLKKHITLLFLTSALISSASGQVCIVPDGYTPVMNGTRKEITVCPETHVFLRATDCAGNEVSANWKDFSVGSFEFPAPNPYQAKDSTTVIAIYYGASSVYRDTIDIKWSESPGKDSVGIYESRDRITKLNGSRKCEYEEKVLYAPNYSGYSNYIWFNSENPSETFGTADSVVMVAHEISTPYEPVLAVNFTYKNCVFGDTILFVDAIAPETGLPEDTFYCEGSTVNLTITFPGTVDWFDAGKNQLFTGSTFPVNQVGKYYVRVESIFECVTEDSIDIYESPKPIISLSNDTTICPNSSANLFATADLGTAPYSFYWNPGTSLSDSAEAGVDTMFVTASPAAATNYRVMVIDDRFCSDTAYVTVGFHPQVVASVPFSDTSACAGIPIFLSASGANGTPYNTGAPYTFSWSPVSDIISGANTASPEVSPADTVIYTVTITDSIGCSDAETVRVKTPDMSVEITGRPEIFACSGDTVNLSSTVQGGQPGYAYLWESVAWLESTNTATSRAFTLADGTQVKLTVTDSRGCSEADSIRLRIGSLPSVTALTDQYYLCFDDSVQIDSVNITGGTGNIILSWTGPAGSLSDPSSPSPLFYSGNLAAQAELIVSVQDEMGCQGNTDTVNVQAVAAPSVNLVSDTSGCQGTPVFVRNNSFGQALSYQWFPENGTTVLSADSALQVDTAGTYMMVVTEPLASCENRDTVTVTFVIPPSSLTIQTDTIAPNHLPHQLTAVSDGQSLQYLWSTNGTGTLTDNTANPVSYSPTDTDLGFVNFTVSASNSCGALTADTVVEFYFDVSNLPALVYIPNAFSPSAIEVENRSLMVFGNKISAQNFLFQVYSRWGDLLYETSEFSEANTVGWNGQNENTGELMHMGVYTYTVKGRFEDGRAFERTGTVTLLR